MRSLPDGYRAVVIGASGGIGAAVHGLLARDPRCGSLVGLHRRSDPALELTDESSIGRAAEHVIPPVGIVECAEDHAADQL